MTDQWTPWRSHTPGPCPVPVGTWMQVESMCDVRGAIIVEGRLSERDARAPNWHSDGTDGYAPITRYRIRIPPAMQLLYEALKVKEVETV